MEKEIINEIKKQIENIKIERKSKFFWYCNCSF